MFCPVCESVFIVGRAHLRPQLTRNNTKHGASVEAKFSILNHLDGVISNSHLRNNSPRRPYGCFGLAGALAAGLAGALVPGFAGDDSGSGSGAGGCVNAGGKPCGAACGSGAFT